MKKKKVEPLCKNCRLYDQAQGLCKVIILYDGQRYNMPVGPDDHCHMDELGIEVQEVRFWVEDPKTGEKTQGDGKVKIQYPIGFFNEQK